MKQQRKNYHKTNRKLVKEILPDYRTLVSEDDLIRTFEKFNEDKRLNKKMMKK